MRILFAMIFLFSAYGCGGGNGADDEKFPDDGKIQEQYDAGEEFAWDFVEDDGAPEDEKGDAADVQEKEYFFDTEIYIIKDKGQDTGDEETALPGKIKVIPSPVDFGFVQIGTEVEITVTVQNIGGSFIQINKISLVKGYPVFILKTGYEATIKDNVVEFTLTPPKILKPGEKYQFKAVFKPLASTEADGEVRIYTNDPDYPDGYTLFLFGNKKMPCIEVNPLSIDFKGIVLGEQKKEWFTIFSCGLKELSIHEISVPPQMQDRFFFDFSKLQSGLAPTVLAPLILQPGDKALIGVTYFPQKVNAVDEIGVPVPDKTDIFIKSNMFNKVNFLGLSGYAVASKCAMPVVTVKPGTEVKVGTIIELSGIYSYSPFGAIKGYKWSVQQPSTSQSAFLPNDTSPSPKFTVSIPGDYKFMLSVSDENNSSSCKTAEKAVKVVAGEGILVELIWDTPGDPDPFNEGPMAGADVDLHFLHPLAKGLDVDKDGKPDGWYDVPYDCFWFNPTPIWGSPNPWIFDDAKLLRDDMDGFGPELLLLGEECVSGGIYKIGVHYWDDAGFGKSYATVRVYFKGNIIFSTEKIALDELDMWHVGNFSCDSFSVSSVNKITKNYVNPNFTPN
ncbi:MAG: hypothetical protein FJ088_02415 [Deltaproteobacteria bacterium]|nr:hypothetical protein [Deltaproteobacteria bacterium]